MRGTLILGLSVAVAINLAALLVLPSSPATAAGVLDPAAQRGLVLVEANCARCHAIRKSAAVH